jgi:hypothetical protein
MKPSKTCVAPQTTNPVESCDLFSGPRGSQKGKRPRHNEANSGIQPHPTSLNFPCSPSSPFIQHQSVHLTLVHVQVCLCRLVLPQLSSAIHTQDPESPPPLPPLPTTPLKHNDDADLCMSFFMSPPPPPSCAQLSDMNSVSKEAANEATGSSSSSVIFCGELGSKDLFWVQVSVHNSPFVSTIYRRK